MEGVTLYLQYSMEPTCRWAAGTSQPVDYRVEGFFSTSHPPSEAQITHQDDAVLIKALITVCLYLLNNLTLFALPSPFLCGVAGLQDQILVMKNTKSVF